LDLYRDTMTFFHIVFKSAQVCVSNCVRFFSELCEFSFNQLHWIRWRGTFQANLVSFFKKSGNVYVFQVKTGHKFFWLVAPFDLYCKSHMGFTESIFFPEYLAILFSVLVVKNFYLILKHGESKSIRALQTTVFIIYLWRVKGFKNKLVWNLRAWKSRDLHR